jgi:hypothetical protein
MALERLDEVKPLHIDPFIKRRTGA